MQERRINLCMAEVRESSLDVTQFLRFTPTWDLPVVLLRAVCRSPCVWWDSGFVVDNHRLWIPFRIQSRGRKITIVAWISCAVFTVRLLRHWALPWMGRVQSKAHTCCAVKLNYSKWIVPSGQDVHPISKSSWFCKVWAAALLWPCSCAALQLKREG